MSQLPNVITVLRILLVIPTGWLLLETRYVEALGLMAVAGASDALDGWMARRFGWMSQFGAAMDPVADKLLVAVTFIIFTVQGYIPIWVAAIAAQLWRAALRRGWLENDGPASLWRHIFT